ncbi:MAG: hypothetical protein AB2598_04015 [Candidatus Thiodiazotropha sp.]
MIASPFDSPEQLKQAFTSGLQRLLRNPGLGSYILVHANACFDSGVYRVLKDDLVRRFDQLAANCRDTLSEGREPAGAEDDQLVFLKLMAVGFDGVHATEFRQSGEWELQFNHVRAFRPSRMSREPVTGISRAFDPNGFNFNKPFLRKEVFWAGELLGKKVELLYNKFPFAPMHGLLVPQRRDRLPQFLTSSYHHYVWNLVEALGERLPDMGVAYNSYGAFASVNHLHFQCYVRTGPLPIEAGDWHHNGGGRRYPLPCEVFTSAAAAWDHVAEMHEREISYNLLYRPGRLYCLARKRQGSYQHAPWTHGFAWYELAGGITTFSRSDFETLDARAIEHEMGKLRV